MKVSHLRDGGLLISSALAQLINNGVKIIPPKAGKPRKLESENLKLLLMREPSAFFLVDYV